MRLERGCRCKRTRSLERERGLKVRVCSLGYEPHNMTWYDMGEGLELRVVSLWVRVYRFWGESYSNRGPNPKP